MNYPFLLTLGLTGLCFLIAGGLLLKYPPKQINNWYGYRTKRSKSSQEAWDFSQVYSAKQMIGTALFMLLIAVVRLFLPYNEEWELIESIGAIVFMIILSFTIIIKTEKKLKNA